MLICSFDISDYEIDRHSAKYLERMYILPGFHALVNNVAIAAGNPRIQCSDKIPSLIMTMVVTMQPGGLRVTLTGDEQ